MHNTTWKLTVKIQLLHSQLGNVKVIILFLWLSYVALFPKVRTHFSLLSAQGKIKKDWKELLENCVYEAQPNYR